MALQEELPEGQEDVFASDNRPRVTEQPGRRHTKIPSIWRNRNYMLLWSGQVVSTLGSTASWIVYPLLILAITNSPEAAGIAGALNSFPYIVLSLPAGALVDRWDRKRVMIICDSLRAVNMATIPLSMWLGQLSIWQLYANALVEGTLYVFFNIAEVAALPRVVVKAQLPEATAQNQAAFAAAGIIGPSLGTSIYKFIGQAAPFVGNAFTYACSVISLFFITASFKASQAVVPADRHLGREIMDGLRWLWSEPLVRFMAFITGGLNFVSAGSGLIVIVLAKSMGAGDAAVGTIFSIGAIGGIAGSVLGGLIQKRFTFAQAIIASVWIQALAFPLYAVAPQVLLLGVISGIIYMTVPIYNVVQFSYRLALIPDHLQGRVNSSFRLLAFGFQPLGSLVVGVVIERAGVMAAIGVFSGALVLLSVLVTINRHVRTAKPIEQAIAESA